MHSTSFGLFERLKHAGPDAPEWRKLRDIYSPMIRHWLMRLPDVRDEIDDVAQEVLVVLFRALPGFERRRHGSFRSWLRQITVNRIRAFVKKQRKRAIAVGGADSAHFLDRLTDPTSELARQWDLDHDRQVFRKLLALVEGDFEPTTWQAFTQFAVEGRPAGQVANDLGMTISAVVQAKSRILRRLRDEAGELLD